MATSNEIGITGVETGILMPQLQHRWRLALLPSLPVIDEVKDLLRRQIVAFKFNYHLQVLEMRIEQNANNSQLHTLVKQFSKLSHMAAVGRGDDISFVIEELDGNEVVNGRYKFSGCRLVDHGYELDYAESGTCQHWLKFTFKKTLDLT